MEAGRRISPPAVCRGEGPSRGLPISLGRISKSVTTRERPTARKGPPGPSSTAAVAGPPRYEPPAAAPTSPAAPSASGEAGGQAAASSFVTRLLDAFRMPGRWPGRVRRGAYLAMLTMLPMVIIAVVTVVVVHVRLQHGPVSLKFLADPIERGINAELNDFSASISDVQASLSPEGSLEFRLKDVVLKDTDGNAVASAPLAAVELSRDALWRLKAAPERVYLIEPQLTLVYSRDQGLSLSFADTREQQTEGEAPQDPSAKPADLVMPAPASDSGPLRHAPLQGQIKVPARPVSAAASMQRLDLAELLAISSARARRKAGASSYLREFGLREARVELVSDNKRTQWTVNDVSIDLAHMKRRSVISGTARIASDRGPWSVSFRTEDSEKTQNVSLKASVRDLVPGALGASLPNLALLRALDLPIAGDASMELATNGVIKSAKLALELGQGNIRLGPEAMPVDAGLLHLDYDSVARRLRLAPSSVKWSGNELTLAGEAQGRVLDNGDTEWTWSTATTSGQLAADDTGARAIPIDRAEAEGTASIDRGELVLSRLAVKAGEAEWSLAGSFSDLNTAPSLTLDGTTSPMTVDTVKALWPTPVLPQLRELFARAINEGNLGAASLKVRTGRFREGDGVTADTVSLQLEASALAGTVPETKVPFEIPKALVTVTGDGLEINVPDAALVSPAGKKVALKAGRLHVTQHDGATPVAEVSVRSQGALQPILDIALSEAGQSLGPAQAVIQSMDGKSDATLSARVPLSGAVSLAAASISGKVKLSDLRAKQKVGPLELQGGNMDIDLTEAGVVVAGDVLVNGVLAKLAGKHALDKPLGEGEPLRITARLDNSDRTQLNLDVNHIVQGEMGVDIAVSLDPLSKAPRIAVTGDLSDAELSLYDLAFKKPRGRPANVTFNVAPGSDGNTELQNFKVIGENIAIEGWVSIDATSEAREFYFPDFSLNVVSRLEVEGKLLPNRVWTIKAKGPTFDGRDFFTKIVSLGNSADRIKPLRPAAGMDVEATVDTVIGHSEVALRNVKVRFSERNDKMAALDTQGTLDGGKPVSAVLKRDAEQARIISGVTTDAGQAFKLIGFYRNIEGGRAQIEINIDSKGAADKSGNLWIEDFRILGDPIVSEVVANTPDKSPGGAGAGKREKKKIEREQIDFTRLFARFSAGHGQLVLEDAAVKGPLLGATIRGKIDYGTERLSLGGTYVPLQGINAAFCDIPVVGQIITGTGCEGLLGITYAIQGPIAQPQVLVNPLSIAAPGIFREIFQMTNPNPKVLPRGDTKPASGRVGSSASPVTRNEGGMDGMPGMTGGLDGWSMDTSGPKKN